jgi:hypothetical protein
MKAKPLTVTDAVSRDPMQAAVATADAMAPHVMTPSPAPTVNLNNRR